MDEQETVATSRELIESLEAENDSLRRGLDELTADRRRLRDECNSLMEQNRELLTDFDPVPLSLALL